MRRLACAALLLVGALVLGGCADPVPSNDELTDALVDSGLPRSEAQCASNAIHDELTPKQIGLIVERGGGGAPRDDTEDAKDPLDLVRAALAECRDASPRTTTTTSTTAPLSTTTLAGSVSSTTAAP